MRRRAVATVLVVVAGSVACSSGPEELTSGGVPQRWYAAIGKQIAKQPKVGAVALLDNGGPCPLRKAVVLHGKKISRVSDHGVVRLGGSVPAVSCSWYDDGTQPVEVVVAQAPGAEQYAELVAGARAVTQVGNVQTDQQVVVAGRTFRVVRTVYPTNPAAGTDLEAALLDESARGRVTLRVSGAHEIQGYDEQAVAADLAAFLTG